MKYDDFLPKVTNAFNTAFANAVTWLAGSVPSANGVFVSALRIGVPKMPAF